jgi:hypothetical protein
VRQHYALGETRGAGRPEDCNEAVFESGVIGDRRPWETTRGYCVLAGAETFEFTVWRRVQHKDSIERHVALLRCSFGHVDVLLAADHQVTFANADLSRELRDGGAGTRGRVDTSSCDHAEESRGYHDLAVTHDGDDIFVGTVGTDAVGVPQSMGDALDEIAELRFVEAVGWVGSILVQDCVVFGERVWRVCSAVKIILSMIATSRSSVLHTKQESQ